MSGFRTHPTSTSGSVVVIASGVTPVPITVDEGETYVVPENTQAVFALPITVNGDLVLDGWLIEG